MLKKIKSSKLERLNKIGQGLALIGLAVAMAGCTISTSSSSGGGSGSLFRSDNKGLTWTAKANLLGVARVANFNSSNIWTITYDPSDNKAVYVGTVEDGLFGSLDSGESWQWAKSLGRVYVRSVAIDPQYRCTIFAAVGNKLYKSIDCARSFQQTYYDNDPLVTVNSVVVDPKDGNLVYIATSRGEVIKSSDRGTSWRTVNRFTSKVIKLFINPQNTNFIYAATQSDGLAVSTNKGGNWQSLKKNLKNFTQGTVFKDLAFSVADPAQIYMATYYGILKSSDAGVNWTKIDLITPKDKATINALAVDPTNNDNIYYVTNTTFYSSKDGGKNWTTKALPVVRVGWALLLDPSRPSLLYLGMRDIKK